MMQDFGAQQFDHYKKDLENPGLLEDIIERFLLS